MALHRPEGSSRREAVLFTPARLLAAFVLCAVAAKLALLATSPEIKCPSLDSSVLAAREQQSLPPPQPPLLSSPGERGHMLVASGAGLAPARSKLLMITIATFSHKDFVTNWVAHLRKLVGIDFLVATFEDEMGSFCKEMGIPFVLFGIEALKQDMQRRGIDFTNGGLAKVAGWQFVQKRLQQGVDILYADVDTAWLRDPREYFDAHPDADIMVSTDCLSHRYESRSAPLVVANWGGEIATQKFPGTWPRCGHTQGDVSGIGFNAGILLLRSRPMTLSFMADWERLMLKFEAPKDGHRTEGLHDMTDQESLIKLLTRGIFPIKEDPPDSGTFLAASGTLRLAALPVHLFCNGHVYFIQRTPQNLGVVPFAVHATFQLGGTPGKQHRMREHHLWLVDPPTYFDGNFIGYDDVLPAELLSYPGHTQLEAHKRIMSFYLHITSHLLALGRALKRTVILPRMLCLCDRDEHPDVLPQCTTSGSDLTLPFICPMDHVLDTAFWTWTGTPFRPYSFLESPWMPLEMKSSVHRLQLRIGAQPGGAARQQRWHPSMSASQTTSGTARRREPLRMPFEAPRTLTARSLNAETVEKMRSMTEGSRVLIISGIGMSIPYCADSLDPEGSAALQSLQDRIIWGTSWCCSDFDKDKGTQPFSKPSTYNKMERC